MQKTSQKFLREAHDACLRAVGGDLYWILLFYFFCSSRPRACIELLENRVNPYLRGFSSRCSGGPLVFVRRVRVMSPLDSLDEV